MCAHSLLAGGHQMCSEKPFVQRDMAALVERAHGRREGLLTGAALVEAGAGALALKLRSLVYRAAMRADRTIGPAQGFKVLAGGGFVGENLGGKVAGHGRFLHSGHESTPLNAVC